MPKNVVLLIFVSLLFVGCSKESEESVKQKFDIVLSGDMAAIVEGLPANALLDKPYTNLLDWRSYEEGQFHYRAIVEFYFFKELPKKIIRKYRYNAKEKKWERYYNQYHSVRGTIIIDEPAETPDSVKKKMQ